MRFVGFLLGFSFICQVSAQKKPVDVYPIGGQSNAAGQGYMDNRVHFDTCGIIELGVRFAGKILEEGN